MGNDSDIPPIRIRLALAEDGSSDIDCTDNTSSGSTSSCSSSVNISLLFDDEAYADTSCLASVDAVASSRPNPSLFSNEARSASGASGGGGDVHLPLLGAICSGCECFVGIGIVGPTVESGDGEFEDGPASGMGDKDGPVFLDNAWRAGNRSGMGTETSLRVGLLPTVYGV